LSPCTSGNPESRLNTYLNPAAFSLAPADSFGNVSRDIACQAPGLANFDISLFKSVRIRERYTAQFRAEALNAFNTPQFASPYTTYAPGSATFGHVTYQTNLPRNLQLGIVFRW
jgi:trimeric autotransporter adhesin